MHKILVLYPQQRDSDRFRTYYPTHLALAAKLPGLRAMRHSFAVEGLGAPSPWFCIFEAEFDDAAAMAAALSSAEGAAVTADGVNYADVPPVLIHYAVNEAA